MSDPFSVAGTAVGITSLGIQTCQILYNYYARFKGYRSDIDNVLKQVEGLQGILKSLDEIKTRFEIDNHAPSSQLHLALEACRQAVDELKKMADKCNTTPQPNDIKARLRDVKKRALWPYKKETLGGMQANLSRFQDNLNLALHSTGFDVVLRNVENLQPSLNTLELQTNSIERAVTDNTGTLDLVHQSMIGIAVKQQQSHTLISGGLSDLQSELSSCNTAVMRVYDHLIRNDGAFRDPTTTPPSLLAEAIQVQEDVNPRIQRSLEAYNSHLQTRTSSAVTNSAFTCRCRRKKRQSMQRGRWFSYISEEEYIHTPDCPYSAHADYSRSVTAQVAVYSRFVGFCLQVGWCNSRRGGWTSPIAPVLRYRAVVSSDSPAFRVFRDVENIIHRREIDRKDIANAFSSLPTKLLRSFGKDASPNDIDQHGNGIFFAALDLIYELQLENLCDFDAILALLDTCIALGVPCDQTDANGLTPVEFWQSKIMLSYSIAFQDNKVKLLSYLTRKMDTWSVLVFPRIFFGRNIPHFYNAISELVRIEEIEDRLDEDDPLLRAIFRRSDTELRDCLEKLNPHEITSKLNLRSHVVTLASWCGGLQVLRSSGFIGVEGTLTNKLWKQALMCGYIEPLELLLRLTAQVTLQDWYIILATWTVKDQLFSTNEHARRDKVLHAIAERLVPSNITSSNQYDRDYEDSLGTSPEDPPLYHARYLSILAAESAWAAGCRNLASEQWSGCFICADEPWYYGTPLWLKAITPWAFSNETWLVIEWLLNHGDDITWTHPVLLTTPAHVCVRMMKRCMGWEGQVQGLEKVRSYLSLADQDGCVCYCSKGGCYVIGCAIQKDQNILEPSSLDNLRRYARPTVQAQLLTLVEHHRDAVWMSSAILRVLTFERLSLTHTCCYRILDEVSEINCFTRPTPEEAKDIHDHERTDIDLLDKLVTEFEGQWAEYTRSFVTFMNRVWKPRMRAVRQEQQVDKKIYEAELRRIGVSLKGSDGENDSDSESDPDWPDDSREGDAEGWYTTDEEDENGADEAQEVESEDRQAD